MIEDIAKFWYRNWYVNEVSPNLTRKQKETILRRISDLTLKAPIWLDRKTNYRDHFPELKPYAHTEISGLQLVSVMEACFEELYGGIKNEVNNLRSKSKRW